MAKYVNDTVKPGANKTTGKAVADIKAVFVKLHGLNGEEPMVGQAGKGLRDDTVWSLENPSGWFPLLTLRGTVTAGQDAPNLEKINVDQFDAPIGVMAEPGDFNFECEMPSFDKEDVIKWLGVHDDEDNAAGVKDTDEIFLNQKLYGFDLDSTMYEATVIIVTRTNRAIVFTHVMLTLTFGQDDKVFILRLAGQVVAPTLAVNKTLYVGSGSNYVPEEESSSSSAEESSASSSQS